VKAITSYLEHREPIRPLLDEEDPAKDAASQQFLTEEEKK
jgi:hypothetical protein